MSPNLVYLVAVLVIGATTTAAVDHLIGFVHHPNPGVAIVHDIVRMLFGAAILAVTAR